MSTNQAYFQTLQIIANGSISASYAAVGSQYVDSLRAFRIINNTDGDMFASWDPTRDQMFIPANGFVLYDIEANSASNQQLNVAGYSQLWIRYSSVPTTGSVYLEAIS